MQTLLGYAMNNNTKVRYLWPKNEFPLNIFAAS